MISKSVPLAPLQPTETVRSAAKPAPQRLSIRASLLVITVVSLLLWVGVVMIAGKLFS